MNASRLLKYAIVPALAELETLGIPDTREARVLLLAIALQESGLEHRRQVVAGGAENGPAASFWQFEGGGCRGVLTHKASSERIAKICELFNVEPSVIPLWEAMRYNDIVAAATARLLLYTLPSKLATTAAEGWNQYVAAWRPGKPHPTTWAVCWARAEAAQ